MHLCAMQRWTPCISVQCSQRVPCYVYCSRLLNIGAHVRFDRYNHIHFLKVFIIGGRPAIARGLKNELLYLLCALVQPYNVDNFLFLISLVKINKHIHAKAITS